MKATSFAGGCFCGAVRYRMTCPPMFVHCCHCRDCQKQTGSAFEVHDSMPREWPPESRARREALLDPGR
jgi:hypothetical protein